MEYSYLRVLPMAASLVVFACSGTSNDGTDSSLGGLGGNSALGGDTGLSSGGTQTLSGGSTFGTAGSLPSGGTTPATGTGGSSAGPAPTGGASVGGGAATGGMLATGGTLSTGGTAPMAGRSAGGTETGGSATGGSTGMSTGGTETGGTESGGTDAGGSAGTETGGTESGGTDAGGSAGTETGGTGEQAGCEGGDYYVATDGNDANPGTMDQPFATLQKAIDTAEAGDLVYVRGGTYEIREGANDWAGVYFHRSGSSDTERIRYFACPGEVPAVDLSNLQIRENDYTTGVVVEGSWLHLKGFEIRNTPMRTRSNTGLGVGGDAHDDIFELLDLHHNNGSGMFINHSTGGHQIINCDSHDNYDPYSDQGDGQNADGFGVHYQESGDVTVFRGCRAWWNSDDGWDFISQEVPVHVENSWAFGNGYTSTGARPRDGNGNGFKIGSSKTGIRHTVTNCVSWGNRSSGFYANHSSGGNDWFNNTSYDNGTQFNMLASTWSEPNGGGTRTDGVILTGSKAHVMRNNISFPLDNTNMQGVDEESNSWTLGLTPSENDFVTVDDSGALGPRQPDGSLPAIDFMKLREGSQMIDKGTDVGLPFDGSAPDLGALER